MMKFGNLLDVKVKQRLPNKMVLFSGDPRHSFLSHFYEQRNFASQAPGVIQRPNTE